MGAKLTKTKNLTITTKTNEEQKKIVPTSEISNNESNATTTTTTEEKKQMGKTKIKKKKQAKSNKKSSTIRVDKSTNTESCILPTSYTEQLVGEPISVVKENVSFDVHTTQIKVIHRTEAPNKDVEELREACLANGIILPTKNNDDNQQSLNDSEEISNNIPVAIVTNGDQDHSNEQQSQLVE